MEAMKNSRLFEKFLTAFCLAFALCQTASAQSTDWQTTEGGQVRVVGYMAEELKPLTEESSTQEPGHLYLTGLIDIELKDGWHTYWRNPGSTGMAPEITLEQGGKADILFPAPKLIMDGKEWTFGYEGHVMLPFTTIVDKQQKRLAGDVTVGLCETICLPHTVSFRFDLDKPADILAQGQIKTARAALPELKPAGFRIHAVSYLKDDNTISTFSLSFTRPQGTAAVGQVFLSSETLQLGIAKYQDTSKHEETETDTYSVSVSGFSRDDKDSGFRYTAILDNGTAFSGSGVIEFVQFGSFGADKASSYKTFELKAPPKNKQ
ncbi:MAG: Disulfide bond corrector protein DsbC [Candidatus Tokpelaia hoelldobleri]|uniref:Disulfide bond corrector protein DsbC n=1 Tax=Candidatus Tokpelaia hoelldobleri TaxID=1902579 RepID=A0A1U9JW65_9HYPH|nr:MAG: Disulfide bond corrector protein DsbC [Candidatus Tokpelaia hoelldoblerii]